MPARRVLIPVLCSYKGCSLLQRLVIAETVVGVETTAFPPTHTLLPEPAPGLSQMIFALHLDQVLDHKQRQAQFALWLYIAR